VSTNMYPMEGDYETEYDSFAELKEHAEKASDVLNYPISWFMYDEQDEDWGEYLAPGEDDKKQFTLTFLMPRKNGQAWSVTTTNFDRTEVQSWLDSFIKAEVLRWYGWQR